MIDMTKKLRYQVNQVPIYCWPWVLSLFLLFVMGIEMTLVVAIVLHPLVLDDYIRGYTMLICLGYTLFVLTLLHFTWIQKRVVQRTAIFWKNMDIPEVTRVEARGRTKQQMRVFYRLLLALILGWIVMALISVLVWIFSFSQYPILIVLDGFRQAFLFLLSWCVPYRTLIHKQLIQSDKKKDTKHKKSIDKSIGKSTKSTSHPPPISDRKGEDTGSGMTEPTLVVV
jgi:hypothetical protein